MEKIMSLQDLVKKTKLVENEVEWFLDHIETTDCGYVYKLFVESKKINKMFGTDICIYQIMSNLNEMYEDDLEHEFMEVCIDFCSEDYDYNFSRIKKNVYHWVKYGTTIDV